MQNSKLIVKISTFSFFFALFSLLSPQAYAHAFGQTYALPVPFWLYAYAAGAAVILSFLFIGFFIQEKGNESSAPSKICIPQAMSNFLNSPSLLRVTQYISIFLFALTILTGLLGTDISILNFSMTFFWIIFFLGLTYLTAIVGNIYAVLNPWRIIIDWIEQKRGEKIIGMYVYPEQLAYYPAFIFYFFFIWIELFSYNTPFFLAIYVLFYSFLTVSGVCLFGKNAWFRYGEFFSVFFLLISKISILTKKDEAWYLRLPFVGLLEEKPHHISLVIFILFMLSSTAFDGLSETIVWLFTVSSFLEILHIPFTVETVRFSHTISLFFSPLVFFALYIFLLWCMKLITKTNLSLQTLALQFGYSLIPIAFVYNFAHYYTLLFIQGQAVIYLVSDPFGFGWNVFGTSDFNPNIAFIDTSIIWHVQVFFILVGHIVAVYIAHRIALQVFPSRKQAILSQIPMLLLMVIYTVIGLWILSQPLTSGL